MIPDNNPEFAPNLLDLMTIGIKCPFLKKKGEFFWCSQKHCKIYLELSPPCNCAIFTTCSLYQIKIEKVNMENRSEKID